ncbi:MAG TPA: type II secretion system protein, partial [Pirellulaceae bacterium]|nr:type II secretion system protein [Pirellulaceae bacterium]
MRRVCALGMGAAADRSVLRARVSFWCPCSLGEGRGMASKSVHRRGFTLVELLVVIAIIGILVA